MNTTNNPLIEALDWVGVDAYPYFQTVNQNSIENAEGLFFDAYDATVGASMGKPVSRVTILHITPNQLPFLGLGH